MVIRRLPPKEKKRDCRIWNDFPNLKFGILEFWNEKLFQNIGIFGIVPKFQKFREKKCIFTYFCWWPIGPTVWVTGNSVEEITAVKDKHSGKPYWSVKKNLLFIFFKVSLEPEYCLGVEVSRIDENTLLLYQTVLKKSLRESKRWLLSCLLRDIISVWWIVQMK